MSEEAVTTPAEVAPSLIDVDLPAPAADDPKTEPAATDDKAEKPAETTEQQEVKKQSRFQRRLDAQKSARIAAETETRLLREQNAKLEAQLKPPQDTGEPQRDQFDDYEAYLRAVARHDAKQETASIIKTEREQNQGREKQSRQAAEDDRISQDWVKRETEFQEQTKDYLEVVTPYVDVELGRLTNDARRLIVEAGPGVLYHLASNPDVADRIADLSPLRQIVEIGKLEDTLAIPVAKKASNAPAPIKPVGQGRSASTGYHENQSDAEYEAMRKTQGAKWAR